MQVQFVIDAVYAFAHALQAVKADLCPATIGLCPGMKEVPGCKFS